MVRRILNGTIVIGAAESTLLSEAKMNPARRLVLEFSSMNAAGGDDVFIAVNEEAAPNKGRRMVPGGTKTWSTDAGYKPPIFRINGYCAGGATITIYEEVEE